jgi:hypothetical protein
MFHLPQTPTSFFCRGCAARFPIVGDPGKGSKTARAMMQYLPFVLWLVAMAWCPGCATVDAKQAACLQQAMAADHKAAMGIFKRVNEEMLPAQIEQGVAGTAFSKDNLSLLAPADVAEWDRILGGLDAYCAALGDLTSGDSSAAFTTASESFGVKIQKFVKVVNGSSVAALANARTAVGELGGVLIKYKASRDARAIAKAADPSFQSAIADLVDALGFAGRPPTPAPHGMMATCEINFRAMNAEKSDKRFKNDAIAGFDAMTPAERRAAIKDFIVWLGAEQDHQELVESVTTLATALDKAAAAHAALALSSPGPVDAAFADLRAEIQNTVQLSPKLQKE